MTNPSDVEVIQFAIKEKLAEIVSAQEGLDELKAETAHLLSCYAVLAEADGIAENDAETWLKSVGITAE